MKCSICDQFVDINNLHPDSLEVPTDEINWVAYHVGCAAGEDAFNGTNPSDEELEDDRAWIAYR